MNPFESLSEISKFEILEDTLLKRASKRAMSISYKGGKTVTARYREEIRITTLSVGLKRHLRKVIKIGKAYQTADPFYKEMSELFVSEETIINSVNKVNKSIILIEKLEKRYIIDLRSSGWKRASIIRKQAYGRLLNEIKKRKKDINNLVLLRSRIRRIHAIDPVKPTVVIVGCPNSGKSSLVNIISSAEKIEVANYPFTTKEVSVGHISRGKQFTPEYINIQIIDTPGLLDRPLYERNLIERKAILALRHLAQVIVFLFDPTRLQYYTINQQLDLYNNIKTTFPNLNIISVVNKIDILSDSELPELNNELRDIIFSEFI